jgi:hypothetical protein
MCAVEKKTKKKRKKETGVTSSLNTAHASRDQIDASSLVPV